MTMISVFRIENKFGQGMYRCRGPRISSAMDYQESEQCHPYASQEIFEFLENCSEPTNYLFGFPSVELMCKWIQKKSIAEHLDKSGFTFCEFLIDERYVIADEAQLIFNKEHAEIISSIFVVDAWEGHKGNPQYTRKSNIVELFERLKNLSLLENSEDMFWSMVGFSPIKITANEMFKEPKTFDVRKPKPYYRVKERY